MHGIVDEFTILPDLLAGEVQASDLARDVQVDAVSRGMKVLSSNNENNQVYGIFGGNYGDGEFFQSLFGCLSRCFWVPHEPLLDFQNGQKLPEIILFGFPFAFLHF